MTSAAPDCGQAGSCLCTEPSPSAEPAAQAASSTSTAILLTVAMASLGMRAELGQRPGEAVPVLCLRPLHWGSYRHTEARDGHPQHSHPHRKARGNLNLKSMGMCTPTTWEHQDLVSGPFPKAILHFQKHLPSHVDHHGGQRPFRNCPQLGGEV